MLGVLVGFFVVCLGLTYIIHIGLESYVFVGSTKIGVVENIFRSYVCYLLEISHLCIYGGIASAIFMLSLKQFLKDRHY